MTIENESVGERINKLLVEHHVSRAELARTLHVTASAVTQKFSGDTFTLRDVCKIADYFHVSVDYLTGRNDTKECD